MILAPLLSFLLVPACNPCRTACDPKTEVLDVHGCCQPTPSSAVVPSRREVRTDGLPAFGLVQLDVMPFNMGSVMSEENRETDESVHTVTLTQIFEIGETEVTQALWTAVMGSNPSAEGYQTVNLRGDDLPVQGVSWFDAVAFCNKLSERLGLPPAYVIDGKNVTWNAGSHGFRLPTEAEWEYAARAGTMVAFAGVDADADLCTVANVPDATARATWIDWHWAGSCTDGYVGLAPVGKFKPNAWGLYDMSGNVFEWTWDFYGNYPYGMITDPMGPQTGKGRVFRGGSWFTPPSYARAAYRGWDKPTYITSYLGVRVARSVP